MTEHSIGRSKIACVILALLAALASCGPEASREEVVEWAYPGGNQLGYHYQNASLIDAASLDRLGLAFEFRDFVVRGRTHRGVESTPLMVGRTLYFSGPWGVTYAVDAATGEHRWTYDPEPDGAYARNACCDAVNRGVAIQDGRVFVASTDGHLAAIDATTGDELWKTDTIVDRQWNYSSSGAPIVAGDVVLIGNSGADMGSRGYLTAYSVATGELAWRFWVVPGDPAAGPDENPDVTAARATWPADTRWNLGLGGNPWDGLAYDPQLNLVYVGTGNGGPHPAWLRSESGAEGDGLYLSSIVALDADTGRVDWHYQTTPGDSWDYAATSPFIMTELEFDGSPRKVIMQAPKNGFFYVLDRETGELLQAQPFTHVNWASHVDMETGRPVLTEASNFRLEPKVIWPSMAGGHSWTPMAFSPRTDLVYLPVFEAGASFTTNSQAPFVPGNANHGTQNVFPPFDDPELQRQFEAGPSQAFGGRLKAIDPVTGATRWQSEPLPFLNGGVLVIGDLVFQGTVDGYLYAYDAATGAELLKLEIGTSISAAPMTYRLDGIDYLAVLAGYGGPQGAFFPPGSAPDRYENFERLVVLKLDGLPVPVPGPRQEAPLNDLGEPVAATAAEMRRGQDIYQLRCNRCHSMGGASGIYPNLWNMPQGTRDGFSQIVGNGLLAYAGMGNYSDNLSRQDIAALRAFIINDAIIKRRDGAAAGAQYREATH